MALIKCPFCNKYYDDNKNYRCPFCFENNLNNLEQNCNQKTMPIDYTDILQSDFAGNENKTQAYEEGNGSEEKTIGLFFSQEDFDPVTGWIVCIKGSVIGKSYQLHMNKNYIGRDKLMEVSIPDDLNISRKNHFSIIYDNKSKCFFAKIEMGSLSINGTNVNHPVKLKENDVLEFGKSKYIFIPYCNEERNWDNKNEK